MFAGCLKEDGIDAMLAMVGKFLGSGATVSVCGVNRVCL